MQKVSSSKYFNDVCLPVLFIICQAISGKTARFGDPASKCESELSIYLSIYLSLFVQ